MEDKDIYQIAEELEIGQDLANRIYRSMPKGSTKETLSGKFLVKGEYFDYFVDQVKLAQETDENKYESNQNRSEKRSALILTSGYNIEGYRIVKYRDFISSEVAVGMGMFKGLFASGSNLTGTESESLGKKLREARVLVKERIIDQALRLDCNAIIGIDIDVTMFGESILGLYANGTAVVIEEVER